MPANVFVKKKTLMFVANAPGSLCLQLSEDKHRAATAFMETQSALVRQLQLRRRARVFAEAPDFLAAGFVRGSA